MENRLCLNTKTTFDLPKGIEVKECRRYENGKSIPTKKPDIRVCRFGCPFVEVLTDKEKSMELWIYLEDKSQIEPMIQWIESIDWLEKVYGGREAKDRCGSPNLPMWRLKKAILEEFYGK